MLLALYDRIPDWKAMSRSDDYGLNHLKMTSLSEWKIVSRLGLNNLEIIFATL